jgi:hypothetical protein
VHCWVKKVLESGGIPRLRILEIVPDDQWEEAERRLIAKYRVTGQLLNLADGGAIPSQTKEQRRSAARASNMAQQAKGKEWAEFVRSKRDLARLLSVYMRQKAFTDAYLLRFDMRLRAADKPHLYGSWANL